MSFEQNPLSIANKFSLAKISSCVFATLYIAGNIFIFVRFPLYSDEYMWQYVNSRETIDKGMTYLFPQCQSSYVLEAPLLWLPYRFAKSYLISEIGLIEHLRFIGILQSIILILLIKRIYFQKISFADPRLLLVFSTLFIGTWPFMAVMTRPEQEIALVFLLGVLLIKKLKYEKEYSSVGKYLIYFALLFICTTLPAIHPKGIAFSLVLCIYIILKRFNPILTGILFLSAASSMFESWNIWSKRTRCIESQWLHSVFQNQTINPFPLNGETLTKLNQNLSSWKVYLANLQYQDTYQSNWLWQIDPKESDLQVIANYLIIIVVLVILFSIIMSLFKWNKIQENSDHVLLFTPLVVILTMTQTTKNFYDSYLPWLLLFLAAAPIMSFWIKEKPFKLRSAIVGFFICTLFISANFQISASFVQSPITQQKKAVFDLLQKCGLSRKEIEKGPLIVDESAILPLWSSKQIVSSAMVSGWWGQDLSTTEMLDIVKPIGLLAISDRIPEGLQATSTESGLSCTRLGGKRMTAPESRNRD